MSGVEVADEPHHRDPERSQKKQKNDLPLSSLFAQRTRPSGGSAWTRIMFVQRQRDIQALFGSAIFAGSFPSS
jgi:hypothetical protein